MEWGEGPSTPFHPGIGGTREDGALREVENWAIRGLRAQRGGMLVVAAVAVVALFASDLREMLNRPSR
jgi:hypothetical protein